MTTLFNASLQKQDQVNNLQPRRPSGNFPNPTMKVRWHLNLAKALAVIVIKDIQPSNTVILMQFPMFQWPKGGFSKEVDVANVN